MANILGVGNPRKSSTTMSIKRFIPCILDVILEDAPAAITEEEGHAGFLHLPSGVLALIFLARKIRPSLSLVDRAVEFCVPTK